MSKGIVRLICITDEKVVSLLLYDCYFSFDYEYVDDNIPTYDMKFKTSFTLEKQEIIKYLFNNKIGVSLYLSVGKIYNAYKLSFDLDSNFLEVDQTRPEGHIVLKKSEPFKEYSGNVEGYYMEG